ncbi:N-acetyltransferase [Paracrocinitomix mangrovi]|uniref:GNAT family N-acetyltransferase n=1 Tax=Paracrocinitomix mangrovi TaxID=2862509 RepID=UPI001C8E3E84|nr:GNAT family N-acetyltransferase [Paracrocinitomix mangrovi]UKN03514.1 N-acetyltransferase [Paracrocinitomix mangrovi]
MRTSNEKIQMKINTIKSKFEFQLEGRQIGYIKFTPIGRIMYLTKIIVPPTLIGKEYGKEMVDKALNAIDKMRFKVIPSSSFIRNYIRKHPEYQNLVYDPGGGKFHDRFSWLR